MAIRPHPLIAAIATLLACTSACNAHADIRGIDSGYAAYVWPGDPFLQALLDPVQTPVPPALVVLNIGNGEGDVSILDATADLLRARRTGYGQRVKVIGYVYTSFARRDIALVKRDIDRWLARRNGKVHYDGIFIDETTRTCGPAAGSMQYRDYYRQLREYVWSKLPHVADIVVNNPGTAVEDCFLDPAQRTADIFMTFEGTGAHYRQSASADNGWVGYLGGNVFNADGYRTGTEYDSHSFWHLVYDQPGSGMAGVIDLAYSRHAGTVGVTDDAMTGPLLNPWDAKPAYLDDAILYAEDIPH